MTGARILVVDDDPAILRAVQRYLDANGFDVSTASTAAGLGTELERQQPDALLLDLLLPDGDGIDLSRSLRAAGFSAPIIVLSAVGDEQRKVAALEEGADDYLTKPFGMAELMARLRVALRRSAGLATEPVLRAGPLALDLTRRELFVDGVPVHLTPKEFDLIRLLLSQQGRLLTQRQILARVWGPEYVDDTHILRTLVYQLRRKLTDASASASRIIENDPGIGYRIHTPEILTET